MLEPPVLEAAGVTRVEQLKADPQNRRTHTPRNAAMIADALRSVGAARSIVIDEDDLILAGNGVTAAATAAGITRVRVIETDGAELIAVRRRGLTPEQKRELAIYDNRTAELAEWNVEQLAADRDAGLTFGPFWTPEEQTTLFATTLKAGRTDPDAVPPERATAIVAGELYQLGAHRLLCGDGTAPGALERVGLTPTFVLTDPPYGMDVETDWSGAAGHLGRARAAYIHGVGSAGALAQTRGNTYPPVVGDDAPFDPAPLFRELGAVREMFLFGADYYAERIPGRTAGSWLVWDKRKVSQAEAIGSEFELVWSRTPHKRRVLRHDWFGFLSSANAAEARRRVHPTQKPTSLLADILAQWGQADDVVADPYAGSGSTLLAAEQLGRRCVAVEIVPSYCQVVIDRWEAFTGQQATRLEGPPA